MFQKLVYFVSQTAIPIGLDFQRTSEGPVAPTLKRHLARLHDNGLVIERSAGQHGRSPRRSPTYRDAASRSSDRMDLWSAGIDCTVDMMARINPNTAEVAGAVAFTAAALADKHGRWPTATEVITSVEQWKIPPNP